MQPQITEGIDNESVSAIGLTNRSIQRSLNDLSGSGRTHSNIIERSQNGIANNNIVHESEHPQNNQAEGQEIRGILDGRQINSRNVNSTPFVRFDFNRIFTDLTPMYKSRNKNAFQSLLYYTKTYRIGDAYLDTIERSRDRAGNDIEIHALIK